MCGAGVIKANAYGNPLLALKIIILFLSGLWLSMNSMDMKAKNYPYMRWKSWFFVVIFLFLTAEYALDLLYFTHIETTKPVSCCSVIFGQTGGSNGLPFGLDIDKLLILFYLLYGLVVLSVWSDMYLVSMISVLFFISIAYYAVVYFFGTYIYELPTHQCPFCMLQYHYYYVGYFVWATLLLGTFFVLDNAVIGWFFKEDTTKLKRVSLLFLTLFVAVCSSYVGMYYLKNGVFL